jgi:hypothetical protein
MTDINLPDYDREEEEEETELLPDLYTETKTGLIYEVRFFDTFCIVRPATPMFYLAIRKMTHVEFSKEFEPFLGDPEIVRAAIRGATPDFIVEI